ncbi:hypothetical protein OO015_09350 [Thermomicrobium sp. 4228-Ro]|uniref:hypothetical protein n=1 Tax=Thermomicrobium sp. 4228-Ro TaxID=2993937 RepID=UPI00224915FA|nr:hypothetical protein [Thermomicrobium sp. 4228-Ro]MCX2727698.1 hypothetical protein [Thermomicrobium sp. 4228-Ro]
MSGEAVERDQPALQDMDLLGRLTQFFDSLDQHVRAGQGWFIFNARGQRGARITAFILSRLAEYQLLYTYYFIPWRDFALNAYMVEVELQALAAQRQALQGRAQQEFDIATRVSRDHLARMMVSDLLIIAGIQPQHRHEVVFLDQAIERRYQQRLSTILITPAKPHELAWQIERAAPGEQFWDRLFDRMYERSLIAL